MSDVTQQNNYTDIPVGEILRRTRMHYNKPLEEVERVLCIKASQLEALENGDMSRLPGQVYIIGFVRTYSEYLGLEGDRMVELLKIQYGDVEEQPELAFPVPASESKIPNRNVLFLSFVVLLVFAVTWSYLGKNNTEEEQMVAAVPASLKESIATFESRLPEIPKAEDLAVIETASGTVQKHEQIIINIVESAWIEIRDASGKSLISSILNPGDIFEVPEQNGLVMDTGNIGGLKIIIGEETLPPLGESGDIVSKVSLDPDNLRKITNKN
jgi:cytoskeletal protein RodZ